MTHKSIARASSKKRGIEKEKRAPYSYLKASTGFSFEALHAGYNAKITLTPMPNANEPASTVGVKTGVIINTINHWFFI
jgi:hypothetical protein